MFNGQSTRSNGGHKIIIMINVMMTDMKEVPVGTALASILSCPEQQDLNILTRRLTTTLTSWVEIYINIIEILQRLR